MMKDDGFKLLRGFTDRRTFVIAFASENGKE